MGDQAVEVSAGEELQVQLLENQAAAAIKIRLRRGSVIVGEATIMTENPDAYLLVMMTWWRIGDDDVAGQRQRVCAALVREAADLAERNGASLMSIVGQSEDLTASGFSETSKSVWLRRPSGAERS